MSPQDVKFKHKFYKTQDTKARKIRVKFYLNEVLIYTTKHYSYLIQSSCTKQYHLT